MEKKLIAAQPIHHRYAIDFGERDEEDCRKLARPFKIIETKVKPERDKVKDKFFKFLVAARKIKKGSLQIY